MTDTALFAVLSGLGGAVIGAAAAVVGPLLLQHRQAEAQTAQEQRQSQHNDHTALVERMIRLRSSTREWQQLLEDTVNTLERGQSVNAQDFTQAWKKARDKVNAAFDEGLYDRRWYVHNRTRFMLDKGIAGRTVFSLGKPSADSKGLGESLMMATVLLEECIAPRRGPALAAHRLAEVRDELEYLHEARAALADHILQRLGIEPQS